MTSRSPVRTNAIIFSILGLIVALLIHFLVLSSPRYNWLNPPTSPQALIDNFNVLIMYVGSYAGNLFI